MMNNISSSFIKNFDFEKQFLVSKVQNWLLLFEMYLKILLKYSFHLAKMADGVCLYPNLKSLTLNHIFCLYVLSLQVKLVV